MKSKSKFLFIVLLVQLLSGASSAIDLGDCERLLTFEDLLQSRIDFQGFIKKDGLEADINNLPVDQRVKDFLLNLQPGSRIRSHLTRLLEAGRSSAEREWGLALIHNKLPGLLELSPDLKVDFPHKLLSIEKFYGASFIGSL